ncbi:MAG: metallophosphoesterase [Endomicrobiales bacterium]
MLIGLISDTHDNLPLIKKAVDYFNDTGVNLVLHAGDLVSPFCAREFSRLKAQMVAVFGNNDGEKHLWRERIRDWGSVHERYYEDTFDSQKLLMMHEPDLLEALAASQQFDVIVYGHTHTADNRTRGKTLIVNPGECGGWLSGRSTIALLDLPKKEARIVEVG